MSASNTVPGQPHGGRFGWLGWLRLGRRRQGEADAAEAPETSLRQRQLEQIGQFLDEHALEVSAATLPIVCNYLNRSDSVLVQAIDRRIRARRPVTREWLDQVIGRRDHADEAVRLRELMVRLDTSLDEFAKSSREAQGAASTYHTELAGQVSELEQVTKAGAVISEMARIGKVMLTRTREIERQMIRSEAQTRTLKRRLEEARRSSEQDHLTGLPNRRAFEAVFDSEFQAAGAAGEQLCVGFCDIDHFKRVNDEHGHDAGDRVLRLVAESLAEVSDDRCHVARHGGEEFVVLLRGHSPEQAMKRLDRVRIELSERHLVNRATEAPFGQITFSAGVADVFAHGDPRTALQAADTALYRAKAEGRNRIVLAGPQDAEQAAAA